MPQGEVLLDAKQISWSTTKAHWSQINKYVKKYTHSASFGYIIRSVIARSYGNPIFIFFKEFLYHSKNDLFILLKLENICELFKTFSSLNKLRGTTTCGGEIADDEGVEETEFLVDERVEETEFLVDETDIWIAFIISLNSSTILTAPLVTVNVSWSVVSSTVVAIFAIPSLPLSPKVYPSLSLVLLDNAFKELRMW